ncbi:hypothetical protein [Methylovulum psychrotolerans]|uniref:Transposase n=1 Tax=Methylovulum psychrotolerans TaxID=1704499 RepID=A0A1Z4C3P7_9GAMM|nr:hypothetical protein [Methylovulum psychrotolerans]ASF48135.1 hypothetical protein CEK71_19845 [Methylovulum psychrotolerans]
MSKTDKVKKPKFTLEFKQDAAKLVLEKGFISLFITADVRIRHWAIKPLWNLSGNFTARLPKKVSGFC